MKCVPLKEEFSFNLFKYKLSYPVSMSLSIISTSSSKALTNVTSIRHTWLFVSSRENCGFIGAQRFFFCSPCGLLQFYISDDTDEIWFVFGVEESSGP